MCRHGLKQFRNGWADGPAYVTQCPIQTGQSYAYDFNVTGQRGTLWWHAHIFWLRATVYGAIVIMPRQGMAYPFPQPDFEFNLVLGEQMSQEIPYKLTFCSEVITYIRTLLQIQENGGMMMLKRWLNKVTSWDCLQRCRMHIQ